MCVSRDKADDPQAQVVSLIAICKFNQSHFEGRCSRLSYQFGPYTPIMGPSGIARVNKSWSRYRRPKIERSCIGVVVLEPQKLSEEEQQRLREQVARAMETVQ